jgi:hypothetical protein
MEDKDPSILKDNSLITQPNQNIQQVEQSNSPLIVPSFSPFLINQNIQQEEQSTSPVDPFFSPTPPLFSFPCSPPISPRIFPSSILTNNSLISPPNQNIQQDQQSDFPFFQNSPPSPPDLFRPLSIEEIIRVNPTLAHLYYPQPFPPLAPPTPPPPPNYPPPLEPVIRQPILNPPILITPKPFKPIEGPSTSYT